MEQRAPDRTISIKLRVGENLQQKLQAAAEVHHVSINKEAVWRLGDSFNADTQRSLDETAQDIAVNWARNWGEALHELNKQGDLLRAAEALLSALDRAEVKDSAVRATITTVRQAISLIDSEARLFPRRGRT